MKDDFKLLDFILRVIVPADTLEEVFFIRLEDAIEKLTGNRVKLDRILLEAATTEDLKGYH